MAPSLTLRGRGGNTLPPVHGGIEGGGRLVRGQDEEGSPVGCGEPAKREDRTLYHFAFKEVTCLW